MSKPGEQSLWAKVIYQAVLDATHCADNHGGNEATRRVTRSKARTWFRPTNRDFIEVCHLAGMDPDSVCEKVATIISRYDAAIAKGETFDLIPADTVPTVKREARRYEHDGKSLTLKEWSSLTGIPFNTLASRLKSYPIEQAIDPAFKAKVAARPIFNGQRRRAKIHTVNGVSKTLQQWADHAGIKLHTLAMRVRKGRTLEQALAMTPGERAVIPYTINGVTKSLAEWADHAGVSYNTFLARMRKGRSLAEAVVMSRGVSLDLPASKGTGGGSTAQETPNIGISV